MSDTLTWIFAAHIVLAIALGLNVVRFRITREVGIGDGGDKDLKRAIRVHANFIEWVPFALLAIGMAELRGVSETTVGILGAVLFVSRLGHAVGFSRSIEVSIGRTGGMTVMITVMLVATGLALAGG
jgi:uncharacterized membrane protein YecN with MAPEG domain